MLKSLFSKREFSSRTGFFKVQGKELIPIDELEVNSINNCIEKLGFPTNQVYTIHSFDSDKISVLGFKTLTKNLEFVLAENKSKISFSEVSKAVKSIDWDFQYSDLNAEDILQEGIDYGNFDLNFVKSILYLTKEDKDLYKSHKYGLYLQFENDMLVAFTSSEWENSSTKWLKDINQNMVESMVREAKAYQRNEIEAMEEVNNQTKALMNVPEAMKNEFLTLHKTQSGNFNFYNLVIAHYTQDCNQDEFLFMNHGRYKRTNERTYEVGNFEYEFGYNKELKNVYEQ